MNLLRVKQYVYLMRLHKPIGIFLLLWPSLWALWLASSGTPNLKIVGIFIIGVILMRSAGCIINDFADRHLDRYVERTRERPLAAGKIQVYEALFLFFILIFCAFLLALNLNHLAILLSFVGAFLAVIYPFLKRVTHLPQIGLGLAFAWGVPMAYAAELNAIPWVGWALFLAAAIWPVIYDTMYAMVDLNDDIKIGIKSSAILFGKHYAGIIGILQCSFLMILSYIGWVTKLNEGYFLALLLAGLFFLYQQYLIRKNYREDCFKAFLNNHWVGMIIFIGIMIGYK
jgi:4-hydroxybenzoate polyprenyltransferase